ncbi:MAG TPA: PD-(D/E)XK nuclease domain-containing protein, partial [Candidatus Spyradenecus faecavium]|nr:PD-(D/E)XK nuclease domain-containing protein [Candidatus Spyradenecus faecavium]
QGRADLVAESDERVYVFELKIKGTAQEALAQIKDRGYAEPYRATGKPIHLIGLAFDPATHTLTDALVEQF